MKPNSKSLACSVLGKRKVIFQYLVGVILHPHSGVTSYSWVQLLLTKVQ